MRFVRVQDDVFDGQFKPADQPSAFEGEAGGTYLIMDLSPSDFIPAGDSETTLVKA